MKKAIQIHPADTIAVALQALVAGERITVVCADIILATDVPAGHKFALRAIAAGEKIIK